MSNSQFGRGTGKHFVKNQPCSRVPIRSMLAPSLNMPFQWPPSHPARPAHWYRTTPVANNRRCAPYLHSTACPRWPTRPASPYPSRFPLRFPRAIHCCTLTTVHHCFQSITLAACSLASPATCTILLPKVAALDQILLVCEVARLRGCEVARLRGCEVARLQGCKVVSL